jgi:hypothetical protein
MRKLLNYSTTAIHGYGGAYAISAKKKKQPRTRSVCSVGHVQRRHAHQQANHARARTVAARIPLSGYDSTGSADANYFHLIKQARYRLLADGSFIDPKEPECCESSSDRVPIN